MRNTTYLVLAACLCLCHCARDSEDDSDGYLKVETAAAPPPKPFESLISPLAKENLQHAAVAHQRDVALMVHMAAELMALEPDRVGKGVISSAQGAAIASAVSPKIVEFLSQHAHTVKQSFFYCPIRIGAGEAVQVYASVLASVAKASELEGQLQSFGGTSQSAGRHFLSAQRQQGWMKSSNPESQQWGYVLWNSFISDSMAFRDNGTVPERSADPLPWNDFKGIFGTPGLSDFSDQMLVNMLGEQVSGLAPNITFGKVNPGDGGWAVKYHPTQPEIPLEAGSTKVNEMYDRDDPTMVADLTVFGGQNPSGNELMKIGYFIARNGRKRVNILPPYPQMCRPKEELQVDQGLYNEYLMHNFLHAHFHADNGVLAAISDD